MTTRMEDESNPTMTAERPKVDLNQADAEELAALPGIGPILAERIVNYRDEHGPFGRTEDLRQVPGIGAGVHGDLEEQLVVAEPASQEPDEDSGNGTAPEFDVGELAQAPPDTVGVPVVPSARGTYRTPPPLAVSATPQEVAAEISQEHETYATPPPLAVSAAPQAQTDESEETEGTVGLQAPEHSEEETPERTFAPEPMRPVETRQRRFGWIWATLLGAGLGAILGMVLALLIFAGINGSIDIDRSQAMTQMRGQVSELSVELDAVRGDVSTLQGDISGLRERVEVLSGLTARMEQAEDALETFTVEIESLQDETAALTTSLGALTNDVEAMGETLDAVEAQTERAASFFEGLQELMQEVFGSTIEPQGAAPAAAEEVVG